MAVLRRLARVLKLVFEPIRNVNAVVQLVVVVGGPIIVAFAPFAFAPGWWTVGKAAFLLLITAVLLTLCAAYQLLTNYEAMLGGTRLQEVVTARIRLGNELLRRMKRRKGTDELPLQLVNEVINWGGKTITGINAIAPDVGGDLYAAHATGPDNRNRGEQMRYVKNMLEALHQLSRDLQVT
jgi:hypothetical protein